MVVEKKVGRMKRLCRYFLLCEDQSTQDFTASIVKVMQGAE